MVNDDEKKQIRSMRRKGMTKAEIKYKLKSQRKKKKKKKASKKRKRKVNLVNMMK